MSRRETVTINTFNVVRGKQVHLNLQLRNDEHQTGADPWLPGGGGTTALKARAF